MIRCLLTLSTLLLSFAAAAQPWPARPVKIIAPFAPGGSADTLGLSGIASHVIAPQLPQGTPYDPLKDFTHVALLGGPPAVLAVNPQLPAKNLREFVELAKAKPLSYGSPGNGTQGQLVAELFKQKAGIDLQHVPYKGASGAVTDLIAGHIQSVSTTLSTAATQIKAG